MKTEQWAHGFRCTHKSPCLPLEAMTQGDTKEEAENKMLKLLEQENAIAKGYKPKPEKGFRMIIDDGPFFEVICNKCDLMFGVDVATGESGVVLKGHTYITRCPRCGQEGE